MIDASTLVRLWRDRGRTIRVGEDDVWFLDTGSPVAQTGPALLLLHGFPTCSFDWRRLVNDLAPTRRVIALDLPGYGLSSKPDRGYHIEQQVDAVIAVLRDVGADEVDLVTHDMGDTVGGALLARDLDGEDIGSRVRRRVLTNGSIYIEMAHLTSGQRLAERIGDRRLPRLAGPVLRAMYRGGITRTCGDAGMDRIDVEALWQLMSRDGGHLNLPRLIRYIDERRAHQDRWTGAIERHPSTVSVVWGGQDPVAVLGMAHRFVQVRPDAHLTVLERVGHFPMLEAPGQFNAVVRARLDE